MKSVLSKITLYDMVMANIGSNPYVKQYVFPHACAQFLQTLDDLQSALDPPYSDGFLFIEIFTAFDNKYNGYLKRIYQGIADDILNRMATNDLLYIDTNYAKFSVKRIKDYVTWTENVQKRFPGYYHD